jgi:hypothetical protein
VQWLLLASMLLAVGSAGASPLNLQNGDVIDTIEWDALYVNGDGGSFTQSIQQLFTNGRITNVDVERSPAFPPTLTSLPQTGVTFTFAVDLVAMNVTSNFVLATFAGASAVSPDVTVIQNGNTILTGDFLGNFVFGGATSSPTLLSSANIQVTGGDPALIGAIGSLAVLDLTASVFGFVPSLATILASVSGNTIGTNFTIEFSGTLRPANPAPFVPEASTAMLLGSGLLGLIAATRRFGRGR